MNIQVVLPYTGSCINQCKFCISRNIGKNLMKDEFEQWKEAFLSKLDELYRADIKVDSFVITGENDPFQEEYIELLPWTIKTIKEQSINPNIEVTSSLGYFNGSITLNQWIYQNINTLVLSVISTNPVINMAYGYSKQSRNYNYVISEVYATKMIAQSDLKVRAVVLGLQDNCFEEALEESLFEQVTYKMMQGESQVVKDFAIPYKNIKQQEIKLRYLTSCPVNYIIPYNEKSIVFDYSCQDPEDGLRYLIFKKDNLFYDWKYEKPVIVSELVEKQNV